MPAIPTVIPVNGLQHDFIAHEIFFNNPIPLMHGYTLLPSPSIKNVTPVLEALTVVRILSSSHGCPLSQNSALSGLGLHLQGLAQSISDKSDLHEPCQSLASLGPYDRLRRFVPVCYAHAKRNIQKCNVNDDVRKLMRSLLCLWHPDWGGTLERIRREGGKAGAGMCNVFSKNNHSTKWCLDWVQGKIRSKFAFPALCWEKSLTPIDIWNEQRYRRCAC